MSTACRMGHKYKSREYRTMPPPGATRHPVSSSQYAVEAGSPSCSTCMEAIRAETDSELSYYLEILIPMIHGYPMDSDIISSDFIAVYLSLHIALHCDMLKVQLNINFKHY